MSGSFDPQKAAWAIRTYIETRPDDGELDEYTPRLKEIRDQLSAMAGGADGDREALQAELQGIADQIETGSGAPLADSDWFDRDRHFGGAHDSEQLVRIGPFAAAEERASTLNERNEERNTA